MKVWIIWAIPEDDDYENPTIIKVFDAKTFVNRFEKPHVYDIPYAELACGYLRVEKIEAISHEKFDVDKIDTSQFWWLQDRFSGSYWRLSSAEDEMEEKKND